MAIKKEIYELGLASEFEFIPSRLMIEDKTNLTKFYFFGLDDEAKIRSTVLDHGYPFRYWFEEFQENKKTQDLDQIDEVLDTFIRVRLPKGVKHQAFFTGNRPRNKYAPMNVHLDRIQQAHDDDTLFIDDISYLDMKDKNGEWLLSEQQLEKIMRVKERDPNTYEWRYHASAVGEESQIYNVDLMRKIKSHLDLPLGEQIISFDIVIDTGYQVSATTFGAVGYTNKQNVVILNTSYFSPDSKIRQRIPEKVLAPHQVANSQGEKKAPTELSNDLQDFQRKVTKITGLYCEEKIVDSAEGALRNQYFKDTGQFLLTVSKMEKDDMIELSRDVMIERQVYVVDIPENEIFWFEMTKYQRDMSDPFKPKIVKIDDHTCDWYQYYCVKNKQKLGIR
jgi:phage terminase large subunit